MHIHPSIITIQDISLVYTLQLITGGNETNHRRTKHAFSAWPTKVWHIQHQIIWSRKQIYAL